MESGGRISEWNEGNFKSMRLHLIQSAINYYKTNKYKKEGGKFNLEHLFIQVDLLYKEGKSKYNSAEIERCERVKRICKGLLEHFPLEIQSQSVSFGSGNNITTINKKHFDMINDMIEDFEDVVKDYNDKHGLTTKNQGYSGMF